MSNPRIIILARKGVSTDILYHSLKKDYPIELVIIEKPVPTAEFLKKRTKKLGLGTVIGQVLFQSTIAKYLNVISKKRRRDILEQYQLRHTPIPKDKIMKVRSINDSETIDVLKMQKPDLVLVNGTRIISKEVLNSIPVKFINIHAGITPKYRNVHGAYWAVVNNDLAHCGVTVHLVDEGIDTGNIMYQHTIKITPKDNFVTYPFLQLAEGIIGLKKLLPDILENKAVCKKGTGKSKIWHHPTLWQYLFYRIFYGKK